MLKRRHDWSVSFAEAEGDIAFMVGCDDEGSARGLIADLQAEGLNVIWLTDPEGRIIKI